MLLAARALIRMAALLLSFAFSTLAAAVFVTFALFLGAMRPGWRTTLV